MRKKYILWTALFTLIPFTLFSQDGNPDVSFGGTGTVQTDISDGRIDFALAIDQMQNGKLLLAGSVETADSDFIPVLVQYNTNGNLSSSFGNNGIVSRDFGNGFDSYSYVGAQSDGKIITGGSIGTSGDRVVILNRYLENGDIDTSFGNNGDLIPFNSTIESSAFAMLNDDSFLIANPVNDGNSTIIQLKKYLADGTLDVSFGVNGTALIENGGQSNAVYFIKLMTNGNIVLAGVIQSGGTYKKSLVRLLPDGSKDASFGTNGIALITEFTNFTIQSIALFDDGQIAVLQNFYSSDPDIAHTRVTRYTASGIFDSSFGTGGQGFIDPNIENLVARSLLIQPNQRLLLYGEYTDFFEGGGNTFIKRYHTNGGGDDSFSISTILNYEYFAEEMLLQDDGKLVCMGRSAWYNGPSDLILERYNNTPLSVPKFELGSLIAFPNPTRNKVTITYDLIENGIAPYQINDVSGKVLMEGNLSGNQAVIDLSELQSGLYFLNAGNTNLRLIKE